jgi:cytochrome P450
MVEYWGKQDRVLTTADDTRTLSLHVLSGAGFGKTHPFQGHDQKGAKSVSADYKESLQTVLDNAILLFLLGTKFISKPWLPSKCRDLNQAVIKFKKYMTEEYEAGKAGVAGGAAANTNLMTQLVRASLEQDGLSETEIYGNLFVFNFAGHDTTAHTFTFAITLLATSPETQQWLAEELDHVFGHRPMKEWDYSEDYPRLKRTLAILYETIRLYSPVPIAKSTGRTDQYLVVEGESYFLPRNSLLIPNHVALHTHPKFWGQDSLCWKPQRWIEQPSPTDLDEERFTAIRRGSFIPWSEGIRICPGKKFSQVEFTAAIAAIFKNWRVEPQVFLGETLEGACARVSKLVEEDTAQVLLLQMLHPERAPLVWKRRETVR